MNGILLVVVRRVFQRQVGQVGSVAESLSDGDDPLEDVNIVLVLRGLQQDKRHVCEACVLVIQRTVNDVVDRLNAQIGEVRLDVFRVHIEGHKHHDQSAPLFFA